MLTEARILAGSSPWLLSGLNLCFFVFRGIGFWFSKGTKHLCSLLNILLHFVCVWKRGPFIKDKFKKAKMQLLFQDWSKIKRVILEPVEGILILLYLRAYVFLLFLNYNPHYTMTRDCYHQIFKEIVLKKNSEHIIGGKYASCKAQM